MNNSSWIHDLVSEHIINVETPESWIYWSLMCCISAAAANSYTLRTFKGNVLYYPNLYVILMGESGLGKGFPVNLAKRLVQQANITRVIAGRSSIQAIVQELSQTKSEKGKPLITDARGFVVNGELSTAIIQDPQALTILTDLFDRNYNPDWTNLLKGTGPEKLKEPYITCLFGSSPAHFYDSIPQANIEGGYIGRNLVVFEERRSKDVDLLDSEEESIDEDKFMNFIVPRFVPHLQKIAKNKIRMIPSENARGVFNAWRRDWRANQIQYNDRTGFINRVPDHTLKVAMCLALSRYDNDKGIIEEEDIKEAITKVIGLIYASEKAATGGGLDPLAAQSRKIIEALAAAPDNQLTRQRLLQLGFTNYDSDTLNKIMETFLEMGWVRRQRIGIGKNTDWLYLLSGTVKESLDEFRRKK